MESGHLTPILLFVYNRPDGTQKVLDALAANLEAKNSLLYIYCDGAKTGANGDAIRKINSTRLIARREDRFKKIVVVEQELNKGLANSVIDGVTKICNEFGSVIVLEDDIVTSPFFLRYMNDALQTYKNYNEVACISGYWYPTDERLQETFFLKNQSCWGWGTWARAWNDFELDGDKLLSQLLKKRLTKKFDIDGSIKYTRMLKEQVDGKNDSWAIRWDAVNFINDRMCLYPRVSLVQNIGFDGSGTHSGKTNFYAVVLADKPVAVSLVPTIEDSKARNELIKFYKKINRHVYFQKLYKLFLMLKFNRNRSRSFI